MARRKSRRNTRTQSTNRRLRFTDNRGLTSLKTALRVDLGALYDPATINPQAYRYNFRIGNYNVGPMPTATISPQVASGRFSDPNALSQGSQRSLFKENTICASRAERREVMHATGSAGKKGQRPAQWKPSSKTRCKK